MSKEIYKRYRPKTLKGVIGQDDAVRTLQKLIDSKKLPQAILFTGPSGCGKTTLARIIKTEVKCGDHDYFEINSADFRGIDMVRDIRKYAPLAPMSGESRVWVIDEAHKLTGDAQEAILKILEDTPRKVYIILCTTNGQKLISAIHTRCTEIRCKGLSNSDLSKVLNRAIDRDQIKVSAEIVKEIMARSEGSARKALVILQQIAGLPESEQRSAIIATTLDGDLAYKLGIAVVYQGFPDKDGKWKPARWDDVAELLRKLADSDAEGVRYIALGVAKNALIGKPEGEGQKASAPKPRYFMQAYKVIDIFSKNFFDSKHAGLVAACYEAIMTK